MNEGQENEVIEAGAAGAPEGTPPAQPTTDEVETLYKDLDIKAPVPSGKTKGRPKSDSVRDKDVPKKGTKDSDDGREKDDASKGKSKDAPTSDKDGDSGDNSDAKGKKVGKDSGEIPDKSEETDGGVRKPKSKTEEDSERSGEDDPEQGTDGAGQESDDSEDSEKTGQDDEKGKRPGKSNPEIEKRFQKLTQEKRERDEHIEKLEKQLQERDRAQEQAKISQEDPEYTVEDFSKVTDQEGNILELDKNQAELAWRRWKDGYDQRATERQARANQIAAQQEQEAEMTRQVMEQSTKAYDALAELQDEYPELMENSDKYDPDFAADAIPILQESIQYLEGTEPGSKDENGDDILPVIIGLKIHPKKILTALKNISNKKRNLPLNGVNDNVEPRSNVSVPHTRSSDPNVKAANELYKSLNIDKRL